MSYSLSIPNNSQGGSTPIPGFTLWDANSPFFRRETGNGDEFNQPLGGLAIQSLAEGTFDFNVVPLPDLVMSAAGAGVDETSVIRVFRWDSVPGDGGSGQQQIGVLPRTGGTISVTFDASYRWLSFEALDPNNGDNYNVVHVKWNETSDVYLWTLVGDLEVVNQDLGT